MKLLRQKKGGNGGTGDAVQSKLEKAFGLPRENTSLNVFSRDERGRLQYIDSMALSDVTATSFLDVVKEMYGGGRFQIVPVSGGGKKAGESFEVSIHGESKLKKKPRADTEVGGTRKGAGKEIDEIKQKLENMEAEKREDRLVQEIRSLREDIRSGDGKKDINIAEVMESMSSTVRNLQGAIPQGPDPVEYVASIADLILRISRESRPPVSATGPVKSGGGLAAFLGSLVAEIERRFAGGMMAGGPAAAAVGLPGLAGAPAALPSEAQPGGGLSGLAQKVAEQQQPETAQPTNILADFDLKALGVDPQGLLHQMLLGRGDVKEIAQVVLYLLDFIRMFAQPGTPVANSIQMFLQYPTMMFDRVAPLLPELKDAPDEYLARLRAAIEAEVADYVREQAEQPADEAAEKTSMTPEQRQEAANMESEDAVAKVADVEPETEAGEEAAHV